MKNIFIKDAKTNQFYCVQGADKPNGPEENDFPYWSDDIKEAYNFETRLAAENEFKFNDVSEGGQRSPEIIEA